MPRPPRGIYERVWGSRGPSGRKVKRSAWGYTVQINGKQMRAFNAAWSREDAERARATRLLGLEQKADEKAKTTSITFAQAAERYLATKARKRSLAEPSLSIWVRQ